MKKTLIPAAALAGVLVMSACGSAIEAPVEAVEAVPVTAPEVVEVEAVEVEAVEVEAVEVAVEEVEEVEIEQIVSVEVDSRNDGVLDEAEFEAIRSNQFDVMLDYDPALAPVWAPGALDLDTIAAFADCDLIEEYGWVGFTAIRDEIIEDNLGDTLDGLDGLMMTGSVMGAANHAASFMCLDLVVEGIGHDEGKQFKMLADVS